MFPCFIVPVDFYEKLSTEFAAYLKPPSIEVNRCRASYPRTQQHDQGAGLQVEPRSCNQERHRTTSLKSAAKVFSLCLFIQIRYTIFYFGKYVGAPLATLCPVRPSASLTIIQFWLCIDKLQFEYNAFLLSEESSTW